MALEPVWHQAMSAALNEERFGCGPCFCMALRICSQHSAATAPCPECAHPSRRELQSSAARSACSFPARRSSITRFTRDSTANLATETRKKLWLTKMPLDQGTVTSFAMPGVQSFGNPSCRPRLLLVRLRLKSPDSRTLFEKRHQSWGF